MATETGKGNAARDNVTWPILTRLIEAASSIQFGSDVDYNARAALWIEACRRMGLPQFQGATQRNQLPTLSGPGRPKTPMSASMEDE